jgi:uncharacterized protein (DUF58 family)
MSLQTAQREFLDPGVLARLSRLELQSRWPMEGNIAGRHKSPHRGSSVEFAEYRKYVAGDDPRFLDWRVLARSDRYYLKEFEADTNLRCHLVLDSSGSMGYGEKFAYARKLAATLGYLAMQQGDAVGLLCCGAGVDVDIPPRRKPAHLKAIFDALAGAKPSGATGLVASLNALAEKIRRRALVVVISDLFHDPTELLHSFQHLRFRKHDLAVFHLLHRSEIEFKFDRPIRFVEMEDRSSLVVEPGVIFPRYREALDLYLERLRRGCREFKADYRLVVTDQDYEKTLADFLLARMRIS